MNELSNCWFVPVETIPDFPFGCPCEIMRKWHLFWSLSFFPWYSSIRPGTRFPVSLRRAFNGNARRKSNGNHNFIMKQHHQASSNDHPSMVHYMHASMQARGGCPAHVSPWSRANKDEFPSASLWSRMHGRTNERTDDDSAWFAANRPDLVVGKWKSIDRPTIHFALPFKVTVNIVPGWWSFMHFIRVPFTFDDALLATIDRIGSHRIHRTDPSAWLDQTALNIDGSSYQ